jgi:hypothetical protein
MEQLIHYVLSELKVIARAPVVFAAALLILAAAIWWAMDWRYSGIIANRAAQISSLETQRDEYKNKLSGATPEEAAQRMTALEKQVGELKITVGGLKDTLDKISVPVSKEPPTPTHDPDTIYQNGNGVGHVIGARVILNQSQIYFDQIENAGNLDKSKTFEYRNYVLRLIRADSYIGMLVSPAGVATNVFQRALCQIVATAQ